MNFNQEVSDYISQAPQEHSEILESLRQLIHQNVLGTTEAIKWGIPVFRKTKDFAYLRQSKKHITFGFYNIDKIEDSNNLLEGKGNTLKHIKIKKIEDIDKELLIKWIKLISS